MSKGKSSNNSECRSRSWSFIQYDDSSPANWRSILDDFHIQWVESPLHDKDINVDGTPKKPHRHILLLFDSVKSYNQILELIEPLKCSIPQNVHSVKGLVRYMSHLDNPEKYQYDKSGIIGHGIDVEDLDRPSSAERYSTIREMIQFVQSQPLNYSFSELVEFSMFEHYEDWFPLLCDNSAFIMKEYMYNRSRSTFNK